jgi:hypothetical protein
MKSKIVNFVAYLPLVIIVSILALVATESSKLQPQIHSTQNNIKDIQRKIVMLDENLLNYEKLLNQIVGSNAQSEKFIADIRSTERISKPKLAVKKNPDKVLESINSATVNKKTSARRTYFLRHGMYPEQKLLLDKKRREYIMARKQELARRQEEYRQMQIRIAEEYRLMEMRVAEAWAGPEGEQVRLLNEVNSQLQDLQYEIQRHNNSYGY